MFFVFLPFLLSFWFVRSVKQILFWIYLWQLKQYQRKRVFDHFRTAKGKKLLFQPFQVIKIGLLVLSLTSFFFIPEDYLLFLPLILFLIYFGESLLYFKATFARRVKNPILTAKTGFLIAVNLLIVVLFPILLFLFIQNIFWFSFLILVFDILLPLIVSSVVLLIQPMAEIFYLSTQKKAKEKINSFKNPTVIAITGSYGKTSTKEYLTTILSSKFKVLSTKEHQNTIIGIPFCILKELKPEHEMFIVEMGVCDRGIIKKICDIIKPKIGIVTGVNEQHLAIFGSMDNLLSAEGGREMLACLRRPACADRQACLRRQACLPKDGLLVVNAENDYCLDLYKKADIKKIAYGFNQAKNIDIKKDSASFVIGRVGFNVRVLGRHNVLNLLGAISVAREIGMSFEEISQAAKKINEKQSSYKIYKNKKGINIIDSTYSANPDGVIADLDYLKLYPGKKIIIMPCLIELGKAAKEVHQKIGKKIAEICDLAIITTKEYFKDIKEGSLKGGMKEDDVILLDGANLISDKIKSFCKNNDTVLLEGRLSENIINRLKK